MTLHFASFCTSGLSLTVVTKVMSWFNNVTAAELINPDFIWNTIKLINADYVYSVVFFPSLWAPGAALLPVSSGCCLSQGVPSSVFSFAVISSCLSDKASCAECFTCFFLPTHITQYTRAHTHQPAVVFRYRSLLLRQCCRSNLDVSLDWLNKNGRALTEFLSWRGT